MKSRGALYLIVGLIALVVVIGAVYILNQPASKSGQPVADSSAPPATDAKPKAAFAITQRTSSTNWSTNGTQTKVSVKDGVLVLTIAPSDGEVDFRTDSFTTVKGQSYVLDYDIKANAGPIELGLMDYSKRQVVQTTDLTGGAGTYEFVAPSDSVLFQLTNKSQSAVTATIAKFVVDVKR